MAIDFHFSCVQKKSTHYTTNTTFLQLIPNKIDNIRTPPSQLQHYLSILDVLTPISKLRPQLSPNIRSKTGNYNHQMNTIPITKSSKFQHIGLVESKKTKELDSFCFHGMEDLNARRVRKLYIQLELLFHVQREGKKVIRGVLTTVRGRCRSLWKLLTLKLNSTEG